MDAGATITIIRELMQAYGILGLIFGLMILSLITTVLPVPMDLVVIYIVSKGFDPALVAFAAAMGTTLAACIDYFIGYVGSGWIAGRVNQEKFYRTSKWLESWGSVAVFLLSLLPAPFEIVALAVGVIRMRFWKFFAATFAGKLIKYGLFAYFGSIILDLVKAYVGSVI